MKIAIGSDHAAYEAKQVLVEHLTALGHQVVDKGTDSPDSCDYPVFAYRVAHAVAGEECERGILICGTGIGMSMAANRVKGVRGTLVHDEFTARMSREHNDSNVLCLGARVLSIEEILQLTDLWLSTAFLGGGHARRIALIDELV